MRNKCPKCGGHMRPATEKETADLLPGLAYRVCENCGYMARGKKEKK